jgi:hypothetical protein
MGIGGVREAIAGDEKAIAFLWVEAIALVHKLLYKPLSAALAKSNFKSGGLGISRSGKAIAPSAMS